jgi:hypothetical protein
MKTKWILGLLLTLFFVTMMPQKADACEIEYEILKGKKEVYNVGDTIIIKVKVALTHRSCPIALKDTKFKLNGMKVLQATSWKQLSSMKFERKLKIIITGAKGNKVTINTIRECEKDGGFGSLKLETVSTE